MGVHAQLAGDHVEHRAICVDDEGCAFDWYQLAQKPALDPEVGGDRATGVGQQWVVEVLRVGELGLFCDGINADAYPACADRREFLARSRKWHASLVQPGVIAAG